MIGNNIQSATLAEPLAIEGRGLFSGQPCRALVLPRHTRYGLTYFRDGTAIEAIPANFHEQPNCTVLSDGPVSVAVTEHLQAALWAAGIDSVEIHVDGPEIPNHDGGAASLYELLSAVPLVSLERLRPQLTIAEGVEVRDGDSYIRVDPAKELSIRYSFAHPELGEQEYAARIDRSMAVRELLPARTFITEREAQLARQAGFLKNDHEEDALVLRDGHPSKPFLYPDEFARHKVLDLFGDLYILPFEWSGNITAWRSGHKLNRELARQLAEMYAAANAGDENP